MKHCGLRQIGMVLHDLCQPLTNLQCRLESEGMIGPLMRIEKRWRADLSSAIG